MKRVLLSASVVLLPFLPYAQEVSKKDTLKQKEKNIDGVVITALGIGKKAKKIGYSTQEINTKQFRTVTTPSVGNLLPDRLPGLMSPILRECSKNQLLHCVETLTLLL